VVVQHTWTNDFLLHVGTVRAMARDPLHPPDPMVGTGFGSPYYSPLILLLAFVVRLGSLSPLAVFGGLALVNAVLLLWSFRRFCGWFTSSSGAALALVATFFLWGINPPVWSGFLSMRSLAEVLPYPSTLAFGLMLLAWDRLLRYQTRHDYKHLVAFGLLAATITLVHSFTAVSTAIGVVAILIAHWSGWRTRDLIGLALAGLGAFLLVAVWPYSSVWDIVTSAPEFAQVHRLLLVGMLDPRQLSCAYGLLGLIPLLLRLQRNRRDLLVLVFGLAASVLVLGVVTAQYQFLRAIPVAMLPLHVAFGAFIADSGVTRVVWRRLAAVAAIVVLLAGLAIDVTPLAGFVGAVPIAWMPASLRAMAQTPNLAGPSHQYDFIRNYAPQGSTVLTDYRSSDRHLNWLGYFTVNPGWPDPWIGDESVRAKDRATLLRPATSPTMRAEIADRYGARCVLITRTPAVTAADAVAGYQRVRVWTGGALFCRERPLATG
jgi:alpha-1,6-mannosyltransferase